MSLSICIIDDDLVSQFATRYCVQQFFSDVDINTCESGEEGLMFCERFFEERKQLPDVIFLDLVMKEMDGWSFLDVLKQTYTGVKLPKVYVLSAFTNAKDRAIAKENAYIAGYFDKPLSRNHLQKLLIEEEKGT
ncbi:response regulator [Flagellimonas sp. S174]|uniref:response regulator n=1 Tax=Flagellimonas sp. S174 TaxID=3410790 RepID=UPI003BF500AF